MEQRQRQMIVKDHEQEKQGPKKEEDSAQKKF